MSKTNLQIAKPAQINRNKGNENKINSSALQNEILPVENIQLSKQTIIQPKLEIGKPSDRYELEADSFADRIMMMPDVFAKEKIQMKPIAENISPLVQTSNRGTSDELISNSNLESKINNSKNKGNPIPENTRAFMESRFGADFSNVKIHTDSNSVQMNKELNAHAFTHGNDIYFNSGEFNPESSSGKHLLAHELTHTIQQNSFIQKKSLNNSSDNLNLEITDETINIPLDENQQDQKLVGDSEISASPVNKETKTSLIQRKPEIVQLAPNPTQTTNTASTPVAPTPPVRKDLVFVMGSSGGFYISANHFFRQHYSSATMVDLKDKTLAGIFEYLRKNISDASPAGDIYIVSHANQDGTLSFGLDSKDLDKQISYGELKNAIEKKKGMFVLNGGIDNQTHIHIKGCNIGRNTDMLNTIDQAFGGAVTVDAPTHKQGFSYSIKTVNKQRVEESREYFNTLILEYPGKVSKTTEELITDFDNKYNNLGYKKYEWEMLVGGYQKYMLKINKIAREKKSAIDKDTQEKIKEKEKDRTYAITAIREKVKEDKKEIDDSVKEHNRTAAEAKPLKEAIDKEATQDIKKIDKTRDDAVAEIKADAKGEKEKVDTWVKENSETKIAKNAPAVKDKVITPFSTPVYNGWNPDMDIKNALQVSVFLNKTNIPKGYVFTKCISITENPSGSGNYDFIFELQNSKKDIATTTYEDVIHNYPKTDADIGLQADDKMEKAVAIKPEYEVARRNMYDWRIEKKKIGTTKIKIDAFLEMTADTIDNELKDESGVSIDPASKTDDTFYFGDSDYPG